MPSWMDAKKATSASLAPTGSQVSVTSVDPGALSPSSKTSVESSTSGTAGAIGGRASAPEASENDCFHCKRRPGSMAVNSRRPHVSWPSAVRAQ